MAKMCNALPQTSRSLLPLMSRSTSRSAGRAALWKRRGSRWENEVLDFYDGGNDTADRGKVEQGREKQQQNWRKLNRSEREESAASCRGG